MKERPILFSGPMVRALLDGTKTQTRRVVKPQPDSSVTDVIERGGAFVAAYPNRMATRPFVWEKGSPYGLRGDRLWVRETWFCDDYRYPDAPHDELKEAMYFRADGEANKQFEDTHQFRWNPSIFLRRWASRITLEITNVRIEPLQKITEADAIAEGISSPAIFATEVPGRAAPLFSTPSRRAGYAVLWRSLNAKRGYSWESNPWVWVITFKRITQ